VGCLGCFGRIGCLALLIVAGVLALVAFLVTRPVGPRYQDGAFLYDVNGQPRQVALTPEAARRFDNEVNGEIPQAELIEAITRGVPITEEELNSRVAEELTQRPLSEHGASVEHVFIRLAASGAKAYIYTSVAGRQVVLSSDLDIKAGNGKVQVNMNDVHAGRLPLDPVIPSLLQLMSDRAGIEQTISLVIPPDVRGIRVEEGKLRVLINPLLIPQTSP